MIQMNNVFSTEGKGDVINEDNKRKNNAAGKLYWQTRAPRIDKDD